MSITELEQKRRELLELPYPTQAERLEVIRITMELDRPRRK